METTTTEPKAGFNPLASAVSEKNYSTGPMNTGMPQRDIPEPSFVPPPPDMSEVPKRESTTKPAEKPATPKPFNPDMAALSEGDKEKAAGQLAVTVVNMYEVLTNMCNKLLIIPERKIRKMQMEGDIDLGVPVPYNQSQFIPLSEFIEEYNVTAQDTMTVDDEFKKDVIPPMSRIFAKHGHGMTDEQYVGFAFLQHGAQNAFRFIEMKQQTRQIMDFAREQTAASRTRPVGMAPVVPMNQIRQEEARQSAPPQQPQSPGPGEQAPVVPIPPVQAQQPIQDRIMQQHNDKLYTGNEVAPIVNVAANTPGTNAQSGLPNFGDQRVLTSIDKIQEQEARDKLKAEKNRRVLDGRVPVRKSLKKKSKNIIPSIPMKKAPGRPRKHAK